MEAFSLAIVLVTVLLVGVDSGRVDPTQHSTGVEAGTNDRVATGQSSGHVCDPARQTIVRRDLTVSVDQQVNDDDH